jgi:hypothetical protein
VAAWEYRVLLISGDAIQQEAHLTVLGKRGWELVAILRTAGLSDNVKAYLKRSLHPRNSVGDG